MDTGTPQAVTLSLTAAAKVAGVSVVTLRKYLNSGQLEAQKAEGRHGDTWQIDVNALAAFVAARYGRAIDLSGLAGTVEADSPGVRGYTESAAELRARLDTTLEELGRYRALVEASEHTDHRVEAILGEQIAELRSERDAARAEVDRLKSRGWLSRVFGGSG